MSPYAEALGYLNMLSTSPRPGFHSVTPRIVAVDMSAQVQFLRTVFGAAGSEQPGRPAEMLIGDSLVMVSPAVDRDPFTAFLYIYVDDADEVYRRRARCGR